MKKCSRQCINSGTNCKEIECRMWIDFKEDHNCSLISIEKHGPMTLMQVGERLNLSFVRVKQIEDGLVKKLSKNFAK